jgi:hypothetical protein
MLPAHTRRVSTRGAKPLHVRLAVVLLAACFLAAAPFGKLATASGFLAADHGQRGGPSFASGSVLLQSAAATESVVPGHCGPQVAGAKESSTIHLSAMRADERRVLVAAAQRMFDGRCTLLALRRSALLFPFHFFW